MSNYIDYGYNDLLMRTGSEETINNINVDQVIPDGTIDYSKTTLQKIKSGQTISSEDFVSGSSGWQIKGNGDVEFNDGTFRGSLKVGSGTSTALLGWSSTLEFSSHAYNRMNWTSGSIILSDGTTYSIAASNTGTFSGIRYVYLDPDTSTTQLQVGAAAADSAGENKILVATAISNTDSSKGVMYQTFGGRYGVNPSITADNIVAETITGSEISANAVTADKISVTTLSAISANCGSITSGTITGATIQTSTSGNRVKMTSNEYIQFYNGSGTEVGRIYGDTGSNATFHIVNPASSSFLYLDAKSAIDMRVNGSTQMAIGLSETVSYNKFRPDDDSTYDLGDSDFYWKDLYIDKIKLASTSVSSPSNGDFWTNGANLYVRLGGTTYSLDKTAV